MLSLQKKDDSLISIEADFKKTEMARNDFLEFLGDKGIPDNLIKEWELVFSEVISNAIIHGKKHFSDHQIHVSWRENDGLVALRVTDSGKGPSAKDFENPRLPSDSYQSSGRGLYIIQHFSDAWIHEKSFNTYTQTIIKYVSRKI